MANMENDHRVALNREQNPIQMRLTPKDELPYLERKFLVFRCERTTVRKFAKGHYHCH